MKYFIIPITILVVLGLASTQDAKAYPDGYCTWANPAAPPGSICIGATGSGRSCNLKMPSCSPIPGQPGTWNPDGYTPKVG